MDRRARFLNEAGRRLASSLDVEPTVRSIASLAVPELADWASVHLLDARGELTLAAAAHADPDGADLVREYTAEFPARLTDATGVGAVVRTGETVWLPEISDSDLARSAKSARHLELLRRVAPRSVVIVPVRARSGILGALALAYATPHRKYEEIDVRIFEDVGYLAAAALANARLYRAEREARALLAAQNEASPDGIFFQGADGRTAYYNARLLEMWGVDASVTTGATVEERFAAVADRFEDPESFSRIALELEREPDRRVWCDVRVKGGKTFECYTAPVTGPDRERLGRVWYYRDVTAHRAMEAQLALARREVAESEKLALVGTLVSGVAHEIRTPLTYVTNTAFLLSRHVERLRAAGSIGAEDAARLHEGIRAIDEGSARAARLVGELRRFARRPSEESGLVDVDEAVRGAVLLFQATHRGRVTVEASCASTGTVRMGAGQIEQVALNLMENASEATPSGGSIRVATSRLDDRVVLTVEDRGPGMAPDVAARVFEPFFTTKETGLGLGLTIVRRIVEGAGGSIALESEPARGTAVRVTLPLANTK